MRTYDRYLSIVEWARRRYTVNGVLILSTGNTSSIYSRIEDAAFEKYMRNPRGSDGCILFA